MTLTFDLKDDF